jgi:heme-degrading monooxygenase HmoA
VISRHWKGITRAGHADDYVRHLESETIPQLRRLPGFVDLSILRREVDAGTEFQIVTRWTSLEAIEAFSGKDVNVAVVPPSVRELMVSYDAEVVHYEVVPRAEATPPM